MLFPGALPAFPVSLSLCQTAGSRQPPFPRSGMTARRHIQGRTPSLRSSIPPPQTVDSIALPGQALGGSLLPTLSLMTTKFMLLLPTTLFHMKTQDWLPVSCHHHYTRSHHLPLWFQMPLCLYIPPTHNLQGFFHLLDQFASRPPPIKRLIPCCAQTLIS